jgi:O-antigen/teichoic acid export membrane protein
VSFFLTAAGMYLNEALLNSQGDTGTTLRLNIVKLVVNLSLAVVLIPRIGVLGLIVSILASQAASTLYGLTRIKTIYRINIDYGSSMKLIASTLLSTTLVTSLLRASTTLNPLLRLLTSGAVFLASYIILTPLLGAINQNDLENLDKLTKEMNPLYFFVENFIKVETRLLAATKLNR